MNCLNLKIGKIIFSYTHQSFPIMNEKELSSIIPVLKNITIQHRGYSVYLKNKNSLGSIVHGNFGAIAPNKINNSAAIIRSEKYVYAPMCF